jgi:hypothetical protein
LAYPSDVEVLVAWSDSVVGETNLAKTVESSVSKMDDESATHVDADVDADVGEAQAGADSDVQSYVILCSLYSLINVESSEFWMMIRVILMDL